MTSDAARLHPALHARGASSSPTSVRPLAGGRRLHEWTDRNHASVVVVGVVNVTPDSFSDGGLYLEPQAACERVDALVRSGADVIEIGGESTRPRGRDYGEGFRPVDADEQLRRVLPALRHAVERGARVAIDTTLPEVARAALAAGAKIVNDVSCLADVGLAEAAAKHDAWLVLMHGRPGATSTYVDVLDEVIAEWSRARDRAVAAGLSPSRIVMDPGLGFGKHAEHNFTLVSRLPDLVRAVPHPVYLGASRKGFLAVAEERAGLPKSEPRDRDAGSLAVTALAHAAGVAAVRVHDVRGTRQALAILDALGEVR